MIFPIVEVPLFLFVLLVGATFILIAVAIASVLGRLLNGKKREGVTND